MYRSSTFMHVFPFYFPVLRSAFPRCGIAMGTTIMELIIRNELSATLNIKGYEDGV
jgi:hypothetical protein